MRGLGDSQVGNEGYQVVAEVAGGVLIGKLAVGDR